MPYQRREKEEEEEARREQSAGLWNWDVIPTNGGGIRRGKTWGETQEATRIQEKQPELEKIFKANRRIFLKKEMDNDVCLFIFKLIAIAPSV